MSAIHASNSTWHDRTPFSAALGTILTVGLLSTSSAGQIPFGRTASTSGQLSTQVPVIVSFMDGSTLRLVVRDKVIPFTTRYGKLIIPVRDVRRIEFATRIPPDVLAKVQNAVADLASRQFRRRESGSAVLHDLGLWAYGALLAASQDKDAEVARRAGQLLRQLQEKTPEEQLMVRKDDVLYTPDSKFTGQIDVTLLHATTSQFGNVDLKLVDMRELRSPLDKAPQAERAMQVGQHVEVEWSNQWWPAEILEVKRDVYRIHYTGYDASFDEWVPRSRIRAMPATPAIRRGKSSVP